MVNAVLVDDEKYDLEGLKQLIPWEELGIRIVYASHSSTAALYFIEGNDTDLLITDIKMPMLSGIELAKRCQEIWPYLKVIFISGYEDFTLAKQALALKAGNYVLKPVDDSELIDTLRKTVSQIAEDRKWSKRKKWFGESLTWYQSEIVSRALEGKVEGEDLKALSEELGLPEGGQGWAAGILEIDEPSWNRHLAVSESRPAALPDALRRVFDRFQASGFGCGIKLSSSQLGFVTPLSPDEAAGMLENLIAEYEREEELSVTIALGGYSEDTAALKESYLKASELLHNKLFEGKGRLFVRQGDRRPGRSDKESADLAQILAALLDAICHYRLVEIDDRLKELFAFYKQLEGLSVYHFAVHVLAKLDSGLQSFNESLEGTIGWEITRVEEISRLETIHELHAWFRYKLFMVSELLQDKRRARSRDLFHQIEAYIDKRLSEDLTLRELANRFGYSPNHLGVMFKEHYGENFSDYMIRLRMEKAKSLLRDPKRKVYEVAEMLGYSSIPYFNRQFKEYAGKTPGEYRFQG